MTHGPDSHRNASVRLSPPFLAALLAGALALTGAARSSQAEQFVLVDYTIEYTKAMADKDASHFFVRNNTGLNPDRPRNWMAPVNYRNGTVHVRTEVLEKPAGGETTQWTLCYMPNRPTGPGYGCTGSGTYKEQGAVVTRQESMTSWWQNNGITWTEGIKEMHFVIKDSDGASGHAHKRSDSQKFFPTKVRITMVQVSAGAQFDASKVPGWGGGSGADGGVADSGVPPGPGGTDGGGSGGAGGEVGSGGSGGGSGSGGASGTGGTGVDPGTGGSGSPPSGTGGSSSSGLGGSGGAGNSTKPPAAASDTSGTVVGCSLAPVRPDQPSLPLVPLGALGLAVLSLGRRRRS